jgi:hypothetical protein
MPARMTVAMRAEFASIGELMCAANLREQRTLATAASLQTKRL